nr:hypothetical protein [Caulifigura coniformis]
MALPLGERQAGVVLDAFENPLPMRFQNALRADISLPGSDLASLFAKREPVPDGSFSDLKSPGDFGRRRAAVDFGHDTSPQIH